MSFDFHGAYHELHPADDYRFYAALAARAGVSRAIDPGCGTGTLARLLARAGVRVTGVDPDPGMLRVARARDPEGRVEWRLGRSGLLGAGSAGLAVMSGHVAQVFTGDRAWLAALRNPRRALVPGGLLAFESRSPGARAWRAWTRELTLPTIAAPAGPVEFWHQGRRRQPAAGQLRHADPQPAHGRGHRDP